MGGRARPEREPGIIDIGPWPRGRETARCPRCNAPDPIPIVYGYPTNQASEAAERGEIRLGGCMPIGPKFECRACGHEWPPVAFPPE